MSAGEVVTWREAYDAAFRRMEGTATILESVLQNGGDKALQAAAMANATDAAHVLHYLMEHDPRGKGTGRERLADAGEAA